MAAKYHQIALCDIFSDCQNKFIDDSPSFFPFFLTTLISLNLFPMNSIRLFIALLDEIGCILFMGSLLPLSFKKSFPSLPF